MNKLLLNKKFFIIGMSFLTVSIYAVFLYLDAATKNLGNTYSVSLKYSTIVLFLILSAAIGSEGYNKKDKLLIWSARLFTVIADYLLVILDNPKYGILCFAIVQIIYITRHSFIAKVNLHNSLLVALIASVVLVFLQYKIDLLFCKRSIIFEGAVYGGILLTGLYTAAKTRRYLVTIGMLFFFLCDINVALYNFTGEFILGFFIWLFYFPSQLLLALSGFKTEYLKKVFKG
jgi:hypothetical protein